jgi:hypothetical protein
MSDLYYLVVACAIRTPTGNTAIPRSELSAGGWERVSPLRHTRACLFACCRASMSFLYGTSRSEWSRTTGLDTLASPPGRFLLSRQKSNFTTCRKTVNWPVSTLCLSVPIHVSLGLADLFLPQG